MKNNNYIFLPICLMGVALTACGGSKTSSISNPEKDYYVVNFNYNTEENNSNYLSIVVAKGQVLEAPKAPTLENRIFENWYNEPACESKYLRWGLEIDKDFTLYANWTSYDALDLDEKVSLFQESLKELGKDAVQVNQTCDATIMYPFAGEDAIFAVHDKYVYKRYKNLTEKEYYQVEENGSATLYGKEQFYYDTTKYYDVYYDLEDPANNETKSGSIKGVNKETFLSIDFQNLFKSCENELVYYAASDKYDEETFEYAFTGNHTKLNKNLETYSYSEGYMVANFSEVAGNYVTTQYAYNFGLVFENGLIKSAKVQTEFLYAIGQEVYQYNAEESIYDFFYNNGLFPEFTGTILK